MPIPKISIYAVGIHFRNTVDFVTDLKANPSDPAPTFMSGAAILQAAAAKYGLRYKLTVPGLSPQANHISYVSYTPTVANDPHPRVTVGKNFPFYGLPLSLTEILAPIGQASQVLQYTVQSLDPTKPTPKVLYNTGPLDPANPNAPHDSAFGSNGFPPDIEIRIRSLNIYCTY